jgi:hypothetical protein
MAEHEKLLADLISRLLAELFLKPTFPVVPSSGSIAGLATHDYAAVSPGHSSAKCSAGRQTTADWQKIALHGARTDDLFQDRRYR